MHPTDRPIADHRLSLLSLSRAAGDANVGQTVLRLAGLAAAAHASEQARMLPAVSCLSGVHGRAQGLVSAREGGSPRKDSLR